jgi:hypothetical protein
LYGIAKTCWQTAKSLGSSTGDEPVQRMDRCKPCVTSNRRIPTLLFQMLEKRKHRFAPEVVKR